MQLFNMNGLDGESVKFIKCKYMIFSNLLSSQSSHFVCMLGDIILSSLHKPTLKWSS